MNKEKMNYSEMLFNRDERLIEEIDRLNNIINELERYISDYKNVNTIQGCEVFYKDELLNKLKELKGE